MLIVLLVVLLLAGGFSAIKERWGILAAIAALVIFCIFATIYEG